MLLLFILLSLIFDSAMALLGIMKDNEQQWCNYFMVCFVKIIFFLQLLGRHYRLHTLDFRELLFD